MTTIDEFSANFTEEPGYLDFARIGPIGQTVIAEMQANTELLRAARFGTFDSLPAQDERMRTAVARVTGFRPDQIVFQPNTSTGLMHTMFGITGAVALSAAEFPSMPFAVERAAQALGVVNPIWLETDYGRLTPATVRSQLTPETVAVGVSLVDFRTGYLADIEGIRQVIGDRLLIVDAIQGFGAVDAPYQVADVVVSGGQKWVRAGWGTGFLALSERAAENLIPVFSGHTGTDADMPLDEVPPPSRGASAFSVSSPDPAAQARLAVALEEIGAVGVSAIQERILDGTSRVIELADEFGIPVASSRDPGERAGIVVLTPEAGQLTALTASLFNHGVTVTRREGSVRVSVHASTTADSFELLRESFIGFASAITV